MSLNVLGRDTCPFVDALKSSGEAYRMAPDVDTRKYDKPRISGTRTERPGSARLALPRASTSTLFFEHVLD